MNAPIVLSALSVITIHLTLLLMRLENVIALVMAFWSQDTVSATQAAP